MKNLRYLIHMFRISKLFLILGCLLGLIALSGCQAIIGDENDSQLPQSEPASWEGTIPGMPTR